MSVRAEERPEYAWLRELKATKGEELRQRYGAHSVGVGRKRVGGKPTDDLALVFYVTRKHSAGSGGPDAIPQTISFTPTGANEPVLLPTDVREAEPAEAEPGPD